MHRLWKDQHDSAKIIREFNSSNGKKIYVRPSGNNPINGPGPFITQKIQARPEGGLVQLFGTLLFNFNTADAMITGLSWRQQDALIWLPNMIGSICFLVASYLAYIEVSHGMFSLPRAASAGGSP